MKKAIHAPEFGIILVHDSESNEISFQCLCGQMASWWKRLVLTDDEVALWHAGQLDLNRLMADVCRDHASVRSRLVPSFDISEIDGF